MPVYNYDAIKPIDISYKPININDSITRIYFKVNNKNLLKSKNSQTDSFDFKSSINIYLQKIGNEYDKIKSHSHNIKQGNYEETVIDYFDIKIDSGKYNVHMEIFDRNRNFKYSDFLVINKTYQINKDYFLVKDSSENVIFNTFINQEQKAKLECKFDGYNEFEMQYYKLGYDDSKINSNKYDSTFLIKTDSLIKFNKEGLYTIKHNDNVIFFILCVYDGFPLITKDNELAKPLEYIASEHKIDSIKKAKNIKLASELFWINLMENSDIYKIKNTLNTYYKRVETANKLFTTNIAGWRTHRGKIYTLFGPPTATQKSQNDEKWIYGYNNDLIPFIFEFIKVENEYMYHDFVLKTSKDNSNNISTAILYWKEGIIFNENKVKEIQNDNRESTYNNPYSPYYRGY